MFYQKFKKYVVLTLIGMLTLMLAGGIGLAKEKKELTPYEWNILSPKEKLEYKTIEIKDVIATDVFFPAWIGEEELPGEKNISKRIQTGDLDTAVAWYMNTLFMMTHPSVKITSMTMPVCGEAEAYKTFVALMMAGEAPCRYRFTNRKQCIHEGWAADITDLAKEWKETPFLEQNPGVMGMWKKTIYKGRYYAIPGVIVCARAITYRKDWFKEAAIFNEEGEPAPPEDWTWMDLIKIAQRFENPKKNIWGFCDRKRTVWSNMYRSFGVPQGYVTPDTTGKYSWVFNTTPQMLEFFQFAKEFKWKSGVFHELPGFSGARNKFKANELAMGYGHWENEWFQEVAALPHLYRKDMLSKDVVGMAPMPTGPQGVKVNTAWDNMWSFNPTLSKEELRAAWDWYHWISEGKALEINLQDCLYRYETIGESALNNYWLGITLCRSPYHYPKRDVVPRKLADAFLSRIPQENIKAFQDLVSLPLEPQPYDFDLIVEPDTTGAWGTIRNEIFTYEDADPEELLKKYADIANRKVYNYKNKGDEEKIKAYAKAIDEYYKKYYPEYGNSKEWRKTFEEYYIVK